MVEWDYPVCRMSFKVKLSFYPAGACQPETFKPSVSCTTGGPEVHHLIVNG